MTDKERQKEMMRRKKTLDIAYGIYKTDGPGVLTPKMQEVMDKYINLEIDYEEVLRHRWCRYPEKLKKVGIKPW